MKKSLIKHLSLVLLIAMLLGVFASCGIITPPDDQTTTTTTTTTTDNGGNSDGPVNYTPPAGEYDIETPEGYNKLTFYWVGKGINYEKCDIWIWYEDVNGQGYRVHECDYGVKVVVNIPEGVEQVGFIVRKDCTDPGGTSWGNATKDGDSDRFAVITGKETYIFLKNGDPNQYTTFDGGKTLEVIKLFSLAGMKDFHTIRYNLTPKTTLNSYRDIKVWDGDKQLTVTNVNTMGKSSSTGLITVEETLELNKIYTVEIAGYEPCPVVPMEIFDSKQFAEEYHYDGTDLGSYIHGDSTTFKVWAPTAAEVVLNLYESGHEGESFKDIVMKRGEKGVWEHTEPGVGHGTYYTYTVTTAVGTQIATDPYGKSAGLNGNRTMVVDLDRTNPEGWDDTNFDAKIDSYSDAFIWEVHVRDFSNLITSSQYKGKYLAFTERGLVNEHGVPVGIDYLVNLGVTHVHLLPVYDYATVNEAKPDEQFNWGYDPKNYNVPEGSYSTDPTNGEVRIREYKAMVQALHDAGIGVIMDVVYNHTYDKNSSFNRIVPYYYYRYTNTGANSSASGCGNDTASERYMYGKFMVESTSYWMEEYNLDGLRFDLMGLHDLETMKKVEKAVHAINPQAIIYGEAWTMGSTINGSLQANQGNISKIPATGGAIGSIAVFNDAMRDGLKGSTFDGASQGYINGSAAPNATKVKFGIQGGMVGAGTGWTVNNAMVINYMSCHDNYTLWDKFSMANGSSSVEERLRMNRLGAALLFISKGTPFIQAGEEMLRSKPTVDPITGAPTFDHNSYNSSDEVNNIKWDNLKPGTNEYNMMLYYKGLAEMRKTYTVLSDPSATMTITDLNSGAIAIHTKSDEGEALIIVNPTTAYGGRYNLGGEWKVVADANRAGATPFDTKSGNLTVAGNMFLVLVK